MALSDLKEPGRLVYRIQFATGFVDSSHLPPPTVDHLNLSWTVGNSHGVNEITQPAAGALSEALLVQSSLLQPDGLHLMLNRPAWTGTDPDPRGATDVLCVLSAPPARMGQPPRGLPASLGRFRISADFELETLFGDPFAPANLHYLWAATVIARDGADRTVTTGATIVGATQQVLGDSPPGITLGAARGSILSPPPKEVAVSSAKAHDTRYAFTLGAYVDCYTGQGQSDLNTSGGYHWENTWTHPFHLADIPNHGPNPITGIGFGLAVAKGAGTPHVIVKEFRVLHWPLVQTPPDMTLNGGYA